MNDLFDAELEQMAEQLRKDNAREKIDLQARALIRRASHLQTRRAKSEEHLLSILPLPIPMDSSIHVISSGDIDALSYLIHLARQTPIETLLISSWCMAMPDIDWIRQKVDCGRIGHIDFCLGEIFPSQYPDEYLAVSDLQHTGLVTLKIARNHAKIIAGVSPDENFHFVIESSANLNTNPRIEQTAIHTSRALYEHYTGFFSEIRSIDQASRPRKIKP